LDNIDEHDDEDRERANDDHEVFDTKFTQPTERGERGTKDLTAEAMLEAMVVPIAMLICSLGRWRSEREERSLERSLAWAGNYDVGNLFTVGDRIAPFLMRWSW
jgi:hypothetical protein